MLKPNIDVETGETYNAWDAVNGEIKSDYRDAEPLLFALNSQNKDETKKDEAKEMPVFTKESLLNSKKVLI